MAEMIEAHVTGSAMRMGHNHYFLHSQLIDGDNQADAEGFINLFGLPLKVRALMQEKAGK